MKAPAVVFPEPGRVEIWDLEVPEPGPDEVRVRTAFSGISQGTERWALTGRYGHFDEDYSEYYPCSPGYQAAGVVEAVGSAVSDVAEGDHGFLSGTRFLHPDLKYPGPCTASHSRMLVAARSEVTPVAPQVDLAAAALYHMAGVSRHRVRLPHGQPGDLVAVIGLGRIGPMSAAAAGRRGRRLR